MSNLYEFLGFILQKNGSILKVDFLYILENIDQYKFIVESSFGLQVVFVQLTEVPIILNEEFSQYKDISTNKQQQLKYWDT